MLACVRFVFPFCHFCYFSCCASFIFKSQIELLDVLVFLHMFILASETLFDCNSIVRQQCMINDRSLDSHLLFFFQKKNKSPVCMCKKRNIHIFKTNIVMTIPFNLILQNHANEKCI